METNETKHAHTLAHGCTHTHTPTHTNSVTVGNSRVLFYWIFPDTRHNKIRSFFKVNVIFPYCLQAHHAEDEHYLIYKSF